MLQLNKVRKFLKAEKIEFRNNYKFSLLSTIKIGGKVAILVTANSYDELKKVVVILNQNKVKWFIIGNGSNSVGAFDLFNGVVIKLGSDFEFIVKDDDETLIVGASTTLASLAKYCLDNSLSGLEWTVGIPAQVGGAVCMNAGAFGHCFHDFVKSVTVMTESGEVVSLDKDKLDRGYRTSMLRNSKYIILSSIIKLTLQDKKDISVKIEQASKKRVASLILGKSVGSTFKNPNGAIAGKLIDDAGLKGYCYKGLKISSQHANIIINTKKASYKTYLKLLEKIKKQVLTKYNIKLEPEVVIFTN